MNVCDLLYVICLVVLSLYDDGVDMYRLLVMVQGNHLQSQLHSFSTLTNEEKHIELWR